MAPPNSKTVYVDCDHKRFVRLRVYSRHPHSMADKPNVACFATEEPKFWPNGHVISYAFVDGEGSPLQDSLPSDTSKQIAIVLNAMDEYAKHANIKFEAWDKKNTEPANIRIAFTTDKTFWSSIGTDALLVEEGPTMDLGLIKPDMNLLTDPGTEGLTPEQKKDAERNSGKTSADVNTALALHAIGHVLGLCHEMEYKPSGRSFDLGYDAESADDCRLRHQKHSHGDRGMSNFAKLDDSSVMRYFTYGINADWRSCDINTSLSDYDKAWLAFHYPKASLHKPAEDGTWAFQTSLAKLFGESVKYQEEALKSGDVSYRRFLYLRYVREQWNGNSDQRLSDTVLDAELVKSVTAAIEEYNSNTPAANKDDNRFTRLMATANILWRLHALAAPHSAPTRMPDGKPLDSVQIQNSIFDLVRLLRSPTPPVVQHTLTAPDSLETLVWKNAVKDHRAKLEERITKNSDDESAKQQLEAVKSALKHDRDSDQVKSDAQAGIDELVRSIKKAHPDDNLEEADVQQFLSWIPLVVSATQTVANLLGFSIDAEGQMDNDASRDAQHGFFDFVSNVPWKDLGSAALKAGATYLDSK